MDSERLYVYSVHLKNWTLVKTYTSNKQPPKVGEQLILDIDDVSTSCEVLAVFGDTILGYDIFIVKVNPDPVEK